VSASGNTCCPQSLGEQEHTRAVNITLTLHKSHTHVRVGNTKKLAPGDSQRAHQRDVLGYLETAQIPLDTLQIMLSQHMACGPTCPKQWPTARILVLCRSVLLGRYCSLCMPLRSLLAFIPLPFFPHCVSLQNLQNCKDALQSRMYCSVETNLLVTNVVPKKLKRNPASKVAA
jgi:hypothetical protein